MIESRVSTKDEKFLKLALNLARRHVGLTGKNPSVGCVITYRDIILGRGTTQIGGRPHAEIMAIKQASEHYLFKKSKKMYTILFKQNQTTKITLKLKRKLIRTRIWNQKK